MMVLMKGEDTKDADGTTAPPSPEDSTWLAKLGPGLITGAADDDPSGIATYSQAGAQFRVHSRLNPNWAPACE